jgi:N-dimethylarginine dimethylaminohydrolase
MCPPDAFDARFLAKRQWRRLVEVLDAAGAELEFLEPRPRIGPRVFTADGAFCFRPGHVLLLQNDGVRGDIELAAFREWFRTRGYRVDDAPPNYRLDGGNLLRLEDGTVLAGLKPNATGIGEWYLARLLRLTGGGEVATVPLIDERCLHLDTAVGVLGGNRFLVHADALRDGRLPLADADAVPVSAADAARFACNVVVVGHVVVTGPISATLARQIARRGFHVERVDLSEFSNAGGGARCLTLPLRPPAFEAAAPLTNVR